MEGLSTYVCQLEWEIEGIDAVSQEVVEDEADRDLLMDEEVVEPFSSSIIP